MVEDVRTERCVRVADLSEIGEQIGRWLEEDTSTEAASQRVADTAS